MLPFAFAWILVAIGCLVVFVLLFRALFGGGPQFDLPDALGTEVLCPRCQHLNPTHAHYCAQCGSRLT
jgi:hypothetical protein